MCPENTLFHGLFLLALSKQEIKQPPSQLVHLVCDIPMRNPCHPASCHSGGNPREGETGCSALWGPEERILWSHREALMSNNEGAVGQLEC